MEYAVEARFDEAHHRQEVERLRQLVTSGQVVLRDALSADSVTMTGGAAEAEDPFGGWRRASRPGLRFLSDVSLENGENLPV